MSIIEKFVDKIGGNIDKTPETSKTSAYIANSQINKSDPLYESVNELNSMPSEQANQALEQKINTSPDQRSIGNRIEIDLDKLMHMGFLTPHTNNHVLFEQFRHLKLELLAKTFNKNIEVGKNKNLVMVTSSMEGEGKTFTSLNLALSIAYEFNTTVLYIDADIFKREASKILSLDGQPGITNYLSQKDLELSQFIYKTNIEKFNIMTCGTVCERVTELYSSNRMKELMNEISRRYNDRLIIIDSPPLLADTSTIALAKTADQILLVVEAEKTYRNFIREALHRIKTPEKVSFILNKSNQGSRKETYYYSYK